MADKNFKLLAYIKEKGPTQTAFATKVGIDRQTLISWINCKKTPSLSSLYAIADTFDADPFELNRQLNFGIHLDQGDTPLQKLEFRVKILEDLINFQDANSVAAAYVLGALQDRDLTVIDLLIETLITVESWKKFCEDGTMFSEDLKDLQNWLEIQVPDVKLIDQPSGAESFSSKALQ